MEKYNFNSLLNYFDEEQSLNIFCYAHCGKNNIANLKQLVATAAPEIS